MYRVWATGGLREEGYFIRIRVFFFVAVLFRARFFLAFTIFTNVADAVTNTAILARSGALSHATVFGRCTFLFKASATV